MSSAKHARRFERKRISNKLLLRAQEVAANEIAAGRAAHLREGERHGRDALTRVVVGAVEGERERRKGVRWTRLNEPPSEPVVRVPIMHQPYASVANFDASQKILEIAEFESRQMAIQFGEHQRVVWWDWVPMRHGSDRRQRLLEGFQTLITDGRSALPREWFEMTSRERYVAQCLERLEQMLPALRLEAREAHLAEAEATR